MPSIESKELNKDKYPNFGERKPIPGLKKGGLFYRKNVEDATMHLFAGGRYEKDGVNGGFVGLKGDISLYDRGKLEVYGGVGNIATAGAKFSHSIWQNDNLALKGYTRAEGAVDLFGKRDFEIVHHNNTQYTDTKTGSVTAECPGQVIMTDNFYNEYGIDEHHIEGFEYDKIYYNTEFNHNYTVNIHNDAILTGDMCASNIKTAIGGELIYTNDKGNFDISLGGEIGLNSELAVKSKYNEKFGIQQNVSLNSVENSDNAFVEYDVHPGYTDQWHNNITTYNFNAFHPNQSVNISNKINLGGFETKLGLESKLYGALNGKVNYRAGKFKFGTEAGLNYSNKQFTPNFKAGVSYLIGDAPIIYNHGAKILFKKNPLSGKSIYQEKNYPKAKLNAYIKGQVMDGVNGGVIGLDSSVPLDNVGTDLNVSAGIGNIITANVNFTQTNPLAHDNWNIKVGLGLNGAFSLTQKDTNVTEEVLCDKEFINNSTDVIEHGFFNYYSVPSILTTSHPWHHKPYEFPAPYGPLGSCPEESILTVSPLSQHGADIINDTYKITGTNKNQRNASSIKMYADLSVEYKKDNLSISAGIEGGMKSYYENPKFSTDDAGISISSSEYKPPKLPYPQEPGFDIDAQSANVEQYGSSFQGGLFSVGSDPSGWYEYYLQWTSYYITNPQQIINGNATHVTFTQKYYSDTQINVNSQQNSIVSFVPKFKPYITPTLSAEYDIKNIGTIGAKASLNGASVTFKRRIK